MEGSMKKKLLLTFYGFFATAGLVLIGSETGDWSSQLFVSTGGMVMFLIGVYFCAETLRGE
jgi:hypothetical protein